MLILPTILYPDELVISRSLVFVMPLDFFFVSLSMFALALRAIEESQIKYVRKCFAELNLSIEQNKIKDNVVTDFNELTNIVGGHRS
jgi:hypothetical protein